MTRIITTALLSAGLAVAISAGCDSDDADKVVQCADICRSYVDCTDGSVSEVNCNQSCEDFPGGNTATAFERCEDCLDNKPGGACENDTLNCATECAEVYAFIESGAGS